MHLLSLKLFELSVGARSGCPSSGEALLAPAHIDRTGNISLALQWIPSGRGFCKKTPGKGGSEAIQGLALSVQV